MFEITTFLFIQRSTRFWKFLISAVKPSCWMDEMTSRIAWGQSQNLVPVEKLFIQYVPIKSNPRRKDRVIGCVFLFDDKNTLLISKLKHFENLVLQNLWGWYWQSLYPLYEKKVWYQWYERKTWKHKLSFSFCFNVFLQIFFELQSFLFDHIFLSHT